MSTGTGLLHILPFLGLQGTGTPSTPPILPPPILPPPILPPGTPPVVVPPINPPAPPIIPPPPTPITPIAAPVTPTTAQFTPANVEMPENRSVYGLIDRYIGEDSPLIQRGRARAAQAMNERGLINSSMALQAADAAVYDVAAPMATSDASLFATQRLANQSALNQAGLANAQEANRMAQAALSAQTTTSTANLQSATQMAQVREGIMADLIRTGLDNTNRLQLQGMNDSNEALLRTNDAASRLFQESMVAIRQIQLDTTMTAAIKQNAITQQVTMLKSALAVIGSTTNINLTSLLNFTSPTPAAGPAIQTKPPVAPTAARTFANRVVWAAYDAKLIEYNKQLAAYNAPPAAT